MATPDKLVDEIRNTIVKGHFASGQPLRQDEIAKMFGTSKIPVREALRQLEGEGLVVSIPNRGLTVSPMSAAELNEICEIRVDLELRAIRLAIPLMTQATISAAEKILDDAERDPNYLEHWSASNWAFHETLYAPIERPLLLKLIEDLHVKTERYLQVHVSMFQYREIGQAEHRAILAACAKKDVAAAARLLRTHINDVGQMLQPYLRQRESSGFRERA